MLREILTGIIYNPDQCTLRHKEFTEIHIRLRNVVLFYSTSHVLNLNISKGDPTAA